MKFNSDTKRRKMTKKRPKNDTKIDMKMTQK